MMATDVSQMKQSLLMLLLRLMTGHGLPSQSRIKDLVDHVGLSRAIPSLRQPMRSTRESLWISQSSSQLDAVQDLAMDFMVVVEAWPQECGNGTERMEQLQRRITHTHQDLRRVCQSNALLIWTPWIRDLSRALDMQATTLRWFIKSPIDQWQVVLLLMETLFRSMPLVLSSQVMETAYNQVLHQTIKWL